MKKDKKKSEKKSNWIVNCPPKFRAHEPVRPTPHLEKEVKIFIDYLSLYLRDPVFLSHLIPKKVSLIDPKIVGVTTSSNHLFLDDGTRYVPDDYELKDNCPCQCKKCKKGHVCDSHNYEHLKDFKCECRFENDDCYIDNLYFFKIKIIQIENENYSDEMRIYTKKKATYDEKKKKHDLEVAEWKIWADREKEKNLQKSLKEAEELLKKHHRL